MPLIVLLVDRPGWRTASRIAKRKISMVVLGKHIPGNPRPEASVTSPCGRAVAEDARAVRQPTEQPLGPDLAIG